MKIFIFAVAFGLLYAPVSDAKPCFVKEVNAPALVKIVESMRVYMNNHGSNDPVVENFQIETLRWDKSACTQAQFLKAARDSNKSKTYNWEPNDGLDKIREYTGSFFKDDSFDTWFAKPDVNVEKEVFNHVYSRVPGLARNLKYMYYGVSDGSWAWENGAIVFSENLDTQLKIYFIGHP